MAYTNNQLTEEEKVELILEKLSPEFQDRLSLIRPRSIMQLNDYCLKIEQGVRASQSAAKRLDRNKEKPKINPARPGKPLQDDQHRKKESINRPAKPNVKCNRCDRLGHVADKCFSSAKEDGSKLDPKTAAPKPPKKRNVNATTSSAAEVTSSPSPLQPAEKSGPVVQIRRVCTLDAFSDKTISYPVKLDQANITAMLDSGAQVSAISEDLALQNHWKPMQDSTQLNAADNRRISHLGKLNLEVEVQIGNVVKSARFDLLVIKGLVNEAVLGMDVLSTLKICASFGTHTISFEDFQQESAKGMETCLITGKDIVLPARSLTVVSANIN